MKCFRCDRCGEYFEQTDTDNFIAIGLDYANDNITSTDTEYHRCSRCIASLYEWNNKPVGESNKELDWI